MRICTSAPKSTERGSLIVSFDALIGLFIAMGLVLGNIARKRGKKPVIRSGLVYPSRYTARWA